jgi:hypothetical protein
MIVMGLISAPRGVRNVKRGVEIDLIWQAAEGKTRYFLTRHATRKSKSQNTFLRPQRKRILRIMA